MIIGVVPNLMAFIDNATHKLGVTLCVYSHDEKGRLHVCCFQNVQDLRSPSRIGAVIESDCHLMLAAGALVIKGRKFCKLYIVGGKIAVTINRQLSHAV